MTWGRTDLGDQVVDGLPPLALLLDVRVQMVPPVQPIVDDDDTEIVLDCK